MDSLFSLHAYWMINAAIALSYILLRFIFSVNFFNDALSKIQKLKLGRYLLLFLLVAFIAMPLMVKEFPQADAKTLNFQPFFSHVSRSVLNPHQTVSQALEAVHHPLSLFSLNMFLIVLYLFGFIFYARKYIKSIFYIISMSRNTYIFRKIGKINILISPVSKTPFCWSGWRKHFIIIPESYLIKNSELKCVLKHEFQHIRHKDTYWLHFITIIKLFCFWNPFIKLWMNWLQETQEFACDEVIIFRKKAAVDFYAQCLLDAARNSIPDKNLLHAALGVNHLSKSMLYRRVEMLFQYKQFKIRKIRIFFTYLLAMFLAAATVYAHKEVNAAPVNFSAEQITNLLLQKDKDNSLGIVITPEVVEEFNGAINSDLIKTYIASSLERMKKFKPYLQAQLKKKSLPQDLMAMPLVQSGYQQMDANKNPVAAAGIWQIIPETAKNFGLTVNTARDDRLNTELATNAALTYLGQLYAKFQNWGLAIAAYEIGEDEIQKLIDKEKSRDVWVLARSEAAPDELRHFLAMFSAQVVLMYHPELVKSSI